MFCPALLLFFLIITKRNTHNLLKYQKDSAYIDATFLRTNLSPDNATYSFAPYFAGNYS